MVTVIATGSLFNPQFFDRLGLDAAPGSWIAVTAASIAVLLSVVDVIDTFIKAAKARTRF